MKHRKSLFFCIFFILLLIGSPVLAATVPEPDATLLYVTDLADVLSADTEEYIAERNDALYAATGAQFAILTVDALPAGYDSESYCYEVFNAWGVGSAEKNNGLLLLLVPDEGKFWMTAGTGLQGRFSGGAISELLEDHLAADFDAGRYDEGVLALFEAVWAELEDLYGTVNTENVPSVNSPSHGPTYTPDYGYSGGQKTRSNFGSVLFLIFVIVLLVLFVAAARPGRRYYTNHTPPPPGNPPYYRVYPPRTHRTVWHVHTPRPPVHRPSQNSRPSSGSFGGSSSGGRSFGGGSAGRSFSSRPSGGSRSFGGGRSHGGGGGRR